MICHEKKKKSVKSQGSERQGVVIVLDVFISVLGS